MDGWRLGHARVRRIGEPGTTWVRATALSGERWVRVEAALPAAPLPVSSGRRPSPLRRLLHLARLERRDIGYVALFAVANGILALATPLAVQVLINWLAFGALLQPLIVVTIVLLVCLALAGAMRVMHRWMVEVLQRRIFVRVVTDISERIVRARSGAFDGRHGPELVNRFFDVLTLQKAAGVLLLDGIGSVLQAAAGLALLAVYHPILLVFDLVILLAMGGTLLLGRGAQRTAIDESRVKYDLAGWMEELARNPSVFRLGGRALAGERTDGLVREWLGSRGRHFRVFFRQYVAVQVIQGLVTAGLLLVCGWLVLRGQLTLGQLVAAEFIVVASLYGFARSCEKLDTFYDLLAGVDKLGTLVDLPQSPRTGVVTAPRAGAARVEVRGAAYAFEGEAVVGPFDLSMAPGDRVAVLGGVGAGKTTLGELVAGVRRPTRGSVCRDGLDVDVLRPEEAWRDAVILSPDGIVRASLRENLALGASVPEEALWEALSDVGLADRVAALPARLATRLATNGAPLTRAEARALLVARARLLAPRLLVVDGLLDGLEPRDRDPLVQALRTAPWTLLVLTGEPAVSRRFDTALHLASGGLHERAPRSP